MISGWVFLRSLAANFSPGQWYHVAAVWDDATHANPRIWIDGLEQTDNTVDGVVARRAV